MGLIILTASGWIATGADHCSQVERHIEGTFSNRRTTTNHRSQLRCRCWFSIVKKVKVSGLWLYFRVHSCKNATSSICYPNWSTNWYTRVFSRGIWGHALPENFCMELFDKVRQILAWLYMGMPKTMRLQASGSNVFFKSIPKIWTA